jgi:hypothetical protein
MNAQTRFLPVEIVPVFENFSLNLYLSSRILRCITDVCIMKRSIEDAARTTAPRLIISTTDSKIASDEGV